MQMPHFKAELKDILEKTGSMVAVMFKKGNTIRHLSQSEIPDVCEEVLLNAKSK